MYHRIYMMPDVCVTRPHVLVRTSHASSHTHVLTHTSSHTRPRVFTFTHFTSRTNFRLMHFLNVNRQLDKEVLGGQDDGACEWERLLTQTLHPGWLRWIGSAEAPPLHPLLFIPFFIMFVVALSANSLLLYVVTSQRSLHSPMYILIAGMAAVDLSLPLVFVPNMLLSFLFDWRRISLIGCLVQMHLVHFTGAFQSSLLLWIATSPSARLSATMSAWHGGDSWSLWSRSWSETSSWTRSWWVWQDDFHSVLHTWSTTASVSTRPRCSNTAVNNLVGLLTAFLIPVADFLFITASHVVIFSSVLMSGRSGVKAIHTCITHIAVITVSLTIALVAFLSYRIRNGLPAAGRVFFSTVYLLVPSCSPAASTRSSTASEPAGYDITSWRRWAAADQTCLLWWKHVTEPSMDELIWLHKNMLLYLFYLIYWTLRSSVYLYFY